MRQMGWRNAAVPPRLLLPLTVIVTLAALSVGRAVPTALAAVGYEASTTNPSFNLGDPQAPPHGIAVDQSSHRIYAAIVIHEPTSPLTPPTPGEILRFESDFSQAEVFSAGTEPLYTGVAVDPVTHAFYAAQTAVNLPAPIGHLGTSAMNVFSSTGTLSKTFSLTETETMPQIATDSSGAVFYPNAFADSVQVFDANGTLLKTITCAGCPGGAFGEPVSVALDSSNNLYVVDLSPDRVLKFTLSAGTYSFSSVLESGRKAGAVAVDTSTNDVFVGGLSQSDDYHVVAYNSSGIQFDDFGAEDFLDVAGSMFGLKLAPQIAVDTSNHRLYVTDLGEIQVYDRVASIKAPQATIESAASLTQLSATLRATLNARGHAALSCTLEYTDDADFQVNGFDDATDLACPRSPAGANDVKLEAKVSSLDPGTTYRYRVQLTTNAGTATTAAESFTTLPSVPPTVTTLAPTGITKSGATFKGKVNPQGGAVSSCRFEYGTSTSYGSNLACTSLPGPVTTEVAQSRAIGGLTAGATYHYRLAVTSNAGTSFGQDTFFVVVNPPSPFDEEEVPPPANLDPTPTLPSTTTPVTRTASPPRKCRKGFKKKRVRGKLRCVKKRKKRRPRR